MQGILELLLYLGLCFLVAFSDSMLLEDMEGSGDDMEYSGLEEWIEDNRTEAIGFVNVSKELKFETSSERPVARVSARPATGVTSPPQARLESADSEDLNRQVATRSPAEEEEVPQPKNFESSGEGSYSGDGADFTPSPMSLTPWRNAGTAFGVEMAEEDKIVPRVRPEDTEKGKSDDFDFETPEMPEATDSSFGSLAKSRSLLERTEVLTGVIAGGLVVLALAVILVSFMVYRLKKKDEGSYDMGGQRHDNVGYQKPERQEEFLA